MRLLQLGLLLALASDDKVKLSDDDLNALLSLRSGLQKCVNANGLGVQALTGGYFCQVKIQFPSDTVPKRIPNQANLKAYLMILKSVRQWLHGNKFGTVLQYSPENLLMLCQMDGRNMHGRELLKENLLSSDEESSAVCSIHVFHTPPVAPSPNYFQVYTRRSRAHPYTLPPASETNAIIGPFAWRNLPGSFQKDLPLFHVSLIDVLL